MKTYSSYWDKKELGYPKGWCFGKTDNITDRDKMIYILDRKIFVSGSWINRFIDWMRAWFSIDDILDGFYDWTIDTNPNNIRLNPKKKSTDTPIVSEPISVTDNTDFATDTDTVLLTNVIVTDTNIISTDTDIIYFDTFTDICQYFNVSERTGYRKLSKGEWTKDDTGYRELQ